MPCNYLCKYGHGGVQQTPTITEKKEMITVIRKLRKKVDSISQMIRMRRLANFACFTCFIASEDRPICMSSGFKQGCTELKREL